MASVNAASTDCDLLIIEGVVILETPGKSLLGADGIREESTARADNQIGAP
jgi:hypothetical protein